jgi:hypothetical protein
MEDLIDMGFVESGDKYIKQMGVCTITVQQDDFEGVLVHATMDKSKVPYYKKSYDLVQGYDSIDIFKDRFNRDFEQWKNEMIRLFQE